MDKQTRVFVYLSDYVLSVSTKANVDVTDIFIYLAHHGHRLKDLANKIIDGEIRLDDFTSLIEKTINTIKEDPTITDKWLSREDQNE